MLSAEHYEKTLYKELEVHEISTPSELMNISMKK